MLAFPARIHDWDHRFPFLSRPPPSFFPLATEKKRGHKEREAAAARAKEDVEEKEKKDWADSIAGSIGRQTHGEASDKPKGTKTFDFSQIEVPRS
jgi:hypothetical protein